MADVLESVETTSFIVEGVMPPETDATGVKLRFAIGDFDEHEAWFILLGEEPIIGRDVLNRYRAILDGPPLDGDRARVTLERIDDA